MTKTEIKATSGTMRGLSENTGAQKTETSSWSARSVTVTVSSSSKGERISVLNERLRGVGSRSASSSK